MMKTINIHLEEAEHKQLKKQKGVLTWADFLRRAAEADKL